MADLSLRQLGQTLVTIDRKLDDLNESLRALISMTARMPDGRCTLINVVGTILDEVQNE